MIKIIKKKINMSDELRSKIDWSCRFAKHKYEIYEGCLRIASKLNLSQVEYIRNLIIGYEIKIPEVKEEQKAKKDEYIIENIVKALEENINCLIKVKNKFHHLGYFEDKRAIEIKI